jgi:hypothetical protein
MNIMQTWVDNMDFIHNRPVHYYKDSEMVYEINVGKHIITSKQVALEEANIGYYSDMLEVSTDYPFFVQINQVGCSTLIDSFFLSKLCDTIVSELKEKDTFDCRAYVSDALSEDDTSDQIIYGICSWAFSKVSNDYYINNNEPGHFIIGREHTNVKDYDNTRRIRNRACELLKLLYPSIDLAMSSIIKGFTVTAKSMPVMIDLFEKNIDNGIISKEKFPQFYNFVSIKRPGVFYKFYMDLIDKRELTLHEAVVVYSFAYEVDRIFYSHQMFSSANFESNVEHVKKVFTKKK